MKSLETLINYQFQNPDLLKTALTHKSFVHENRAQPKVHNEKLEFLGDAVVDLAISEILMARFADDSEGQLSKKRASLVNEMSLAEISENLGISEYILLGKGELQSGGGKKPRLLASALEAIFGAIFKEAGFAAAKNTIEVLFTNKISNLSTEVDFDLDYKTRLQEIVQSEAKPVPAYRLVSESGPSHERVFEVEVNIQSYPSTIGVGRSKKAAEQEAARLALKFWEGHGSV